MRGEGGNIIYPTELWSRVSPTLLDVSEAEGDGLWDSLLWTLQTLLTSPVPQTASMALQALSHASIGNDPSELLKGVRGALWRDVGGFLEASVSKDELTLGSELLSAGAVEGFEIVVSDAVSEPVVVREPMKFVPMGPHAGWLQTAGVEFPLELKAARFVVADESVFEENQLSFLMQFSCERTPIVLFCYRMEEALAQELGRGWRDGWSRVIPCQAEDSPVSQEFRMNLLADTAWITGSSLCNYVSKIGLRDLKSDSQEISVSHPSVSVLGAGIKFPAFSTRKMCRVRSAQILSRLEAPDEHSELLIQRANYINGAEAQLLVPSHCSLDMSPQGLDMVVSAYRAFMDSGTALWGDGERPVPMSSAVVAIKHARALSQMFEAHSLSV